MARIAIESRVDSMMWLNFFILSAKVIIMTVRYAFPLKNLKMFNYIYRG